MTIRYQHQEHQVWMEQNDLSIPVFHLSVRCVLFKKFHSSKFEGREMLSR